MAKKLSNLQLAQQKAEAAAKKTNQKINELGRHIGDLYASLTEIQALFDRIRNVPEENRLKYENLKAIRVNWKQQAEKIELEYKKAEVKAAGQGAEYPTSAAPPQKKSHAYSGSMSQPVPARLSRG